jgi:DNA-binding GntR family transcriptional regulator
LTVSDRINKDTLGIQVENALKEEIISGQLEGLQRIGASHYAEKWSISTTPIRDAFKKLETEGWLQISPRRGVFVNEIDWKELKEIFEVRMAIETTAIRLATPNVPQNQSTRALEEYLKAQRTDSGEREKLLRDADFRVHELAMEYCGNVRLQKLAESIHHLVRWSQQTLIRNLPRPYEDTLEEHIEICRAVCRGDAEQAAISMRLHLEKSLQRIHNFLGPEVAPRADHKGITL